VVQSPAPPSKGPRRILPISTGDDSDGTKDESDHEDDGTKDESDHDEDAEDESDHDEDGTKDESDHDEDEPPPKRPKTTVKRVVMTSYTVSNSRGPPQFVIRYKYGERQYETGLRAFEQWLTKEKDYGSFPAAIKAGFIIFADTFKKVVTTKKVSERQTNIMKVLLKGAKKASGA
jgi:hypothetical protein